MKQFLFFLFLSMQTFAQAQSHSILEKDLKPWFGKWKGTYSYLDIESGAKMEKKVTVEFGPVIDSTHITFITQFENGDFMKSHLRISEDGSTINYLPVVSKSKGTGVLKFVLESEGEDAGQKANIRETYDFSKKDFLFKREVKYRDQRDYFTRSTYKLQLAEKLK